MKAALLASLVGVWSCMARAESFGWLNESAMEGASFGCLHCKLLRLHAFAEGADELRVEPGTGRDLRNYAPSRPADIRHMKLAIDIPDMNTPRLSAKQTLTLAAVGRELAMLPLNAQQMEIQSVTLPDSSPLASTTRVSHSYDGEKLSVSFDPPLPPGVEATLDIRYTLDNPADGLFWTPESPEWKGRPAQIHTQGQPETNRFWFPSHDFPNERFTTEILATVPEGFIVSANGREASKARTDGGRTTFHWLQDKDHVGYLVSMIVGKFDIKDVAPAGSKLPMPVYVPPGKGDQIDQTYGRTADMVKVFEQRFDEPYPWDRYAQLVVWNFGAGGMENTSASTMYDTAIFSEKALEDDDLDGLISHELAHQWFGDLVTCNTWAHIWLNEGWATYSTGLWYEARDGEQEGYLRYMHGVMRGIADADQLAPDSKETRPGMVSPIYKHPWETFRRVSNPYPKGASIIHMLRRELGDELFFKGVGVYVDRFKNKTVETDDFRRTLEEVSGVGLEGFFEQWCKRPGTPHVRVKAEWKSERKQLVLTLDQKQRIDADHPAYVFDLPIEIYSETSEGATPIKGLLRVEGARHELTFDLAGEPAMVLIDPDLHVLMRLDYEAPRPWLTNQLWTARSIASRLDAPRQLQSKNAEQVRASLLERLMKPDHHTVRAAAARALGEMKAADELVGALEKGIDSAKVRRAVLEALGAAGGDRAVERLMSHADDEKESYACRESALEWLGRRAPRGETTYLPIYERALASESQHDRVRTGALRGLRHLDAPEGIKLAAPFTRFGTLSRTRPEAIATIAKLAHHDDVSAFRIVEPLLTDSEERTVRAAIDALVEIEHPDGVDALRRAEAASKNPDTKERAENARSKLLAKLRRTDTIDAAQAEIERLKADLKRLEKQVEEK